MESIGEKKNKLKRNHRIADLVKIIPVPRRKRNKRSDLRNRLDPDKMEIVLAWHFVMLLCKV